MNKIILQLVLTLSYKYIGDELIYQPLVLNPPGNWLNWITFFLKGGIDVEGISQMSSPSDDETPDGVYGW